MHGHDGAESKDLTLSWKSRNSEILRLRRIMLFSFDGGAARGSAQDDATKKVVAASKERLPEPLPTLIPARPVAASFSITSLLSHERNPFV